MGFKVEVTSKGALSKNVIRPVGVLKAKTGSVFREVQRDGRSGDKPSYFINLGLNESSVLVLYWIDDDEQYHASAQAARELERYVKAFMVEDVTDSVQIIVNVHDKNA